MAKPGVFEKLTQIHRYTYTTTVRLTYQVTTFSNEGDKRNVTMQLE